MAPPPCLSDASISPFQEHDVVDESDPTQLIKDSSGHSFDEFQLPIHPSTPSELSFISFIDERRLESNPSPASSPHSFPLKPPRDPTRRGRSGSLGYNLNAADPRQDDVHGLDDGVESDLTEQEDLEEDGEEEQDEEEDEDSAPEQRM